MSMKKVMMTMLLALTCQLAVAQSPLDVMRKYANADNAYFMEMGGVAEQFATLSNGVGELLAKPEYNDSINTMLKEREVTMTEEQAESLKGFVLVMMKMMANADSIASLSVDSCSAKVKKAFLKDKKRLKLKGYEQNDQLLVKRENGKLTEILGVPDEGSLGLFWMKGRFDEAELKEQWAVMLEMFKGFAPVVTKNDE